MIRGALRRDPEEVARWARTLPGAAKIVVYCVHGHEVSQDVAGALKGLGLDADFLEGGIESWKARGGALDGKPREAPTRWVTRERPKIDRIACPWLISRFIDREAWLVSCDFKENPAGFVEIDRPEILAIDLLRRPKAMVRDEYVRHLRLSRVICGAECDVMNRAPAKPAGKKTPRLAYIDVAADPRRISR